MSPTNTKPTSTKDNSITTPNNKMKSVTVNKQSLGTNKTHLIKNINNIDTPEELHFFYVNILQSGKIVENKFDLNHL